MSIPDSKAVLWANVSALMTRDFGGENLTRLARDAGFGNATSTRLKECKTSVGVDVIERLAKLFDVEPWQLLTPDLGADLYMVDAEHRFVPVVLRKAGPRIAIAHSADDEGGAVPGSVEAEVRRSRQKGKKDERHKD